MQQVIFHSSSYQIVCFSSNRLGTNLQNIQKQLVYFWDDSSCVGAEAEVEK